MFKLNLNTKVKPSKTSVSSPPLRPMSRKHSGQPILLQVMYTKHHSAPMHTRHTNPTALFLNERRSHQTSINTLAALQKVKKRKKKKKRKIVALFLHERRSHKTSINTLAALQKVKKRKKKRKEKKKSWHCSCTNVAHTRRASTHWLPCRRY
jgi:hypothetical protein